MATKIYLGNPPEHIVNWIKAEAERKKQEMLITPLTFTAEEAGAKLSLVSNNGPDVTLETSTTGKEGPWTPYTVGTEITLANVGDKVMFRNSSDEIQVMADSNGHNSFSISSGKIAASGNIMFLMDKTGELRDLFGKDNCYSFTFAGCTSLTKAPILPAITLNNHCYEGMFYGCTSLKQVPELPSFIELYDYSCAQMFVGCTSLIQAPELPSTFINPYCYAFMFAGCTSLTKAPKILPSEYLFQSCYEGMFYGCTSLTQAPELPATDSNLYIPCSYQSMFGNCKSPFTFPNKTFDEVVNLIQYTGIIGPYYWEDENGNTFNPIEIICSDKTMLATFDENESIWTITEK